MPGEPVRGPRSICSAVAAISPRPGARPHAPPPPIGTSRSTGAEICSNDDHTRPIRVLAFSANGALLLTAADDKLVKLWDTKTWACVNTL